MANANTIMEEKSKNEDESKMEVMNTSMETIEEDKPKEKEDNKQS
jgi:hypothetical protein